MTRDEIIQLAREATGAHIADYFNMNACEIERFAALVAAAEREACAKVCESMAATPELGLEIQDKMLLAASKRIRARGEKGQS